MDRLSDDTALAAAVEAGARHHPMRLPLWDYSGVALFEPGPVERVGYMRVIDAPTFETFDGGDGLFVVTADVRLAWTERVAPLPGGAAGGDGRREARGLMYRQLHGDLVALFGAEARAETRRAARDIADDGGAAMTAATNAHECRNPPCVRPDHLTPLTPAEHRMAHSELRRIAIRATNSRHKIRMSGQTAGVAVAHASASASERQPASCMRPSLEGHPSRLS